MRFTGMAAALDEQMQMDGLDDMAFEERLGILPDREQAVRETRRMKTSTSAIPAAWISPLPSGWLTILDRLVHSAHKIKLKGESMRKKRADLT